MVRLPWSRLPSAEFGRQDAIEVIPWAISLSSIFPIGLVFEMRISKGACRVLAVVVWCASVYHADADDSPPDDETPNIVVIFCDDLGYGDLGTFGHPTIRTPHLDQMAHEGQKWTNFYVGASVCTPSRAALMTGRLPIRSGMCSNKRRVLFPDSGGGLPASEVTIAEALKPCGYRTACVGKWHLGHLPQFLPTQHGFDHYFGIPYSNDMDQVPGTPGYRRFPDQADPAQYNVPLMRQTEIIERPADQTTITRRYTEESVRFIKSTDGAPFFLYLAHSMPHIPLFRSDEFAERSLRGLYGDVIEEIDWSVGQVLDAVRSLDRKTLVVFSSDNGPWLTFHQNGGSAGLLRGGKGGTYEGGMREPTIFWGPGIVHPGVVMKLGATMDLLPTLCALAGADRPTDRPLDGYDLSATLRGDDANHPRNTVIYYRGTQIFAVRKGPYKAHFITRSEYGRDKRVTHERPLLHHLEHDPSEKYDVGEDHPDVIAEIREIVTAHKDSLTAVTNQLEIPLP